MADATYNVRTLVVKRRDRYVDDEVKDQQLCSVFIGLQEAG